MDKFRGGEPFTWKRGSILLKRGEQIPKGGAKKNFSALRAEMLPRLTKSRSATGGWSHLGDDCLETSYRALIEKSCEHITQTFIHLYPDKMTLYFFEKRCQRSWFSSRIQVNSDVELPIQESTQCSWVGSEETPTPEHYIQLPNVKFQANGRNLNSMYLKFIYM